MSKPTNAINETGSIGVLTFDSTATFATANNSSANALLFSSGASSAPSFSTSSTPYLSGISFDSGSNTISIYETGTWTPTIYGVTTTGTTTYTTQTGVYVRVASMTVASFLVSFSAATGTGDLRMGGLPYVASGTLTAKGSSSTIISGGATWSSGQQLLTTVPVDAQTYVDFYLCKQVDEHAMLQMANTSTTIRGTICYLN